jgi:hypothetical protein
VAAFRPRLLAAVAPLLLAGFGWLVAGATEYPRLNGQHHLGRPCTLDDPQVAGGAIVSAAGEEVAAGGGTGAGCDSFGAYELHTGRPTAGGPSVQPGVYLYPGADTGRPG